MSTRARKLTLTFSVLAVALLTLYPAPARRAHAQEDAGAAAQGEKKAEPACVVYGRAVYADTGRPVRRARIRLMRDAFNQTGFGALTNARGEFRIKEVPAGSYLAMIDSPGLIAPASFIGLEQMRMSAREAAGLEGVRKFFDLIEVDGKSDKEVTIRAHRGATIAGKVTYADGTPAIEVGVRVLRRKDGNLSMFLNGLNSAVFAAMHTDDRGIYRIVGLPPGDYVIGVSEKVEHSVSGGGPSVENDAYETTNFIEAVVGQHLLVTYYPSTPSVKDATAVTVDEGDERDGVDISITDRSLRTIAGIVRGKRDGRLIRGARVKISRKEQDTVEGPVLAAIYGRYSQSDTRTDEQGRWKLKEIPEGLYTISVEPPEEDEPGSGMYGTSNMNSNMSRMNSGSEPPRHRKRYAPVKREVRVEGGDVSELSIELSEGARISGTIIVEGVKPESSYVYVSAWRVSTSPEEVMSSSGQSANMAGNEFAIEGLSAGRFFIHPGSSLEHVGFYLKEISWNGKDFLREPIDVGEGASIEGVRIVFSSNSARLEVRSLMPDRTPAPNINIFLLPADISKWSLYAPQIYCSTGNSGVCTVNAAPGDYIVVPFGGGIGLKDIESDIRRRALTAQRVSIRDGETKTVEVSAPEN